MGRKLIPKEVRDFNDLRDQLIDALQKKNTVQEEMIAAQDELIAQLTEEIQSVRKAKTDLLDGADLPLEGLSVDNGELTYNGFKWDNMSGSEQLKVATAIVRKLNPNCGFVLIDKLEQMDTETLKEFGQWAEKEGLQIIGTRVSTGSECSIIIEDGYVKDAGVKPAAFDASTDASEPLLQSATPTWKAGSF